MNNLEILNRVHEYFVFNRRVKVLSKTISKIIPKDVKSILDVGCGDGLISFLIKNKRKKIKISGLEVLKRSSCLIDTKIFDGKTIPLKDSSRDLILFIDVLHHTNNIESIFKDSIRVTKKYVIVKDHIYQTQFDYIILKIMDWFGNRGHGVNLVYNYKKKKYWTNLSLKYKANIVDWNENLRLYPFPFNFFFGRRLHFIALFKK